MPLIGFAGSPFTLACYMIEGGGSADFATVRRMAYARPDLLQRLVDVNARAVAAYLNEQIAQGADAVMMFDTWGGLLSTAAYRAFSLASMRSVLAALQPAPDGRTRADDRLHQGRRRSGSKTSPACGASAVGLDWTVDIARARGARRRARRAAGQPRSAGAADRPRDGRARSGGRRARGGARARAHLQSRPRHRAGDAARERRGAGRRRARANRAQPAPRLDPRAASLGKAAQTRVGIRFAGP